MAREMPARKGGRGGDGFGILDFGFWMARWDRIAATVSCDGVWASFSASVDPDNLSITAAAAGVQRGAEASGASVAARRSSAVGTTFTAARSGSQSRQGRPYQSPESQRAAPRSSHGGALAPARATNARARA